MRALALSLFGRMNYVGLRARNDIHLVRKLWHAFSGMTGLYIYNAIDADPKNTGITFVTVALVMIMLEMLRLRLDSLNRFALVLMGPFMRESERTKMSGLPYYALGVGLSLLLFEERIAVLSICFLVFADPIASYVGITLGKDKILPNKSLQGAVAGFIVCYLLTLVFGIFYGNIGFELLIFSIIAGFIGSFSEILSAFGMDDNLTIPVFSGFGLSLLNFIMGIF